jgi:hypothetical protein
MRLASALLCGSSLLLAACDVASPGARGAPTAAHAAPIVNGTMDTGDPAVVLIQGPHFFCTGSLVAPRLVLTARHCVVNPDTDVPEPQGAHAVGFGDGWTAEPFWVATTGYVAHEGTFHASPETDIAVLFLAEDAPAGIQPIPVNGSVKALPVGTHLRLVGYGDTDTGTADGLVKRQGDTTVNGTVPFTVYFNTSPSNTCHGDSGGPNLVKLGDTEYIAGVTSTVGFDCSMGLGTSVRPDAYLDWLSQFFDPIYDKQAPTVTITAPAAGAAVAPGFTVRAEASDYHVVVQVQLLVDGEAADLDREAPYELNAPANLAAGAHTIQVVATDGFDNVGKAEATVQLMAACADDSDCEEGEECASGVCAGALGSDCRTSADCASDQCFHDSNRSICASDCASDHECPSGFACQRSQISPATKCFPAGGGGGGCAVGGPGSSSPGASLLLVVATLLGGALAARARRRQPAG